MVQVREVSGAGQIRVRRPPEPSHPASPELDPVKNGAGYAVCDTQGPIGRIVADNISSLDDVMLLAGAPQLYEASGDAFVVFDDARDLMEGWGELADKLGAGLDAATLGRTGDGEREKEED